jgi:hypothetical protein
VAEDYRRQQASRHGYLRLEEISGITTFEIAVGLIFLVTMLIGFTQASITGE